MKNSIRINLNLLIQHFNITEAELARQIRMPRATINRLTTGKIEDPKLSTLSMIANYFKVSIDQLSGQKPIDFQQFKIKQELSFIPLYNINDINQLPTPEMSTKSISVIVNQDNKNNSDLFATYATGDAMWPLLDDSTVIIMQKNVTPKNRDLVLVHQKSSKQNIIRRILLDGNQAILEPINNKFGIATLNKEDNIIGVAVQISKNLC